MLDFFKKSNPPKSAFSGSSPLGQKLAAESEKKGEYQWKDAPLSITEIVSTCLDVAFGGANGGHDSGFASLGNQTLQGGQGAHKASAKLTVPPSPLFVGHGHSTGDATIESPATLKFLQRRKIKEAGGTGLGVAASAATIGSLGHLPVNPVSIVKADCEY